MASDEALSLAVGDGPFKSKLWSDAYGRIYEFVKIDSSDSRHVVTRVTIPSWMKHSQNVSVLEHAIMPVIGETIALKRYVKPEGQAGYYQHMDARAISFVDASAQKQWLSKAYIIMELQR